MKKEQFHLQNAGNGIGDTLHFKIFPGQDAPGPPYDVWLRHESGELTSAPQNFLARTSMRTNQDQSRSTNTEREMLALNNPNVPITQRTVIKCCCGKVCKGNRGLKMHQRSCQVLHGLNNELCADLEDQLADNKEIITADDQPPNA